MSKSRLILFVLIFIVITVIVNLAAIYGSVFYDDPPPPRSYVVSLTDVDGDGDLDAVVGNGSNSFSDYGPQNADGSWTPNTIWLNDGSGNFSDSGQQLKGAYESFFDRTDAVALGDLDGDGDIDAMFGSAVGSPNTVWLNTMGFTSAGGYQPPNAIWLNDGAGQFELQGELRIQSRDQYDYDLAQSVVLGDLDLDGDVDAYIAHCCRTAYGFHDGSSEPTTDGHSNAYNVIWFNDGSGQFKDSGQRVGNFATGAVALGDLDGDGDLDAFDANMGIPEWTDSTPSDMVWLNDGAGHFTDSGQRLGDADGYAVALGDVDDDGDLDAVVGNAERAPGTGHANEVWLNDGAGNFSDSGQRLGNDNTYLIVLSDFDHDGDLDAFAGNDYFGQLWLNDGSGLFSGSDQTLDYGYDHAVAIGDVNGDGNEDVFDIHYVSGYRVWFNDGAGRFHRN
jgi:hypothetical protein